MAQFDIFKNQGKGRDYYPFFMAVQHDLFNGLNTSLVIPLTEKKNLVPARGIHPIITINDNDYVLLTDLMTSVENQRLKTVPVMNANSLRSEIISALDLLVMGI